ncbi:MAG: HDOD domain-containing protein [Desulfobacterales bacterium]|nr:HDOD domain-containing protein [Desulfobacterales bacterium]
MCSENIAALTTCIQSFPTLPTVVNRVMEITANPESSASELMAVIRPDVSLTAVILKTSNSAFFGLSRKVSTLEQAITILGFKEIRNVVIARAVFDSFKHLKKDKQFNINIFWEHSFVCGLAAKIIAKELKYPANEFFIAGLIHDIGKLVMYMTLPGQYSLLLEESKAEGKRELELEIDKFGLTHDDVGMRLLKRWLFPDNLIAAVGYHHRLEEQQEEVAFSIIIHVADILAHLSESATEDSDEQPDITASFYPEILKIATAHGIIWVEDDLNGFRQQLEERKVQESDALSLFMI